LDAAESLRLPKLGLFAWDVVENRLTADDVYADFYNIDPDRLVRGLEIEQIIGQIIPDDREHAARVTHTALLTGKFSSVVIRVQRRGIVVPVLCHGRCLRDEEALPTIFTGGLTEYSADLQRLFALTSVAH